MKRFLVGAFVLLFALLGVSSPARAEDSDLPLPVVGANMASRDRCTMQMVLAPWNSAKAGKAAIDYAKAGALCLAAEGDFALASAKAQAIVARGDAEAALIASAAIPVMNGGSVDYESLPGGVRLVTGGAAEWHAYGTAVAGTGNGVTGSMGFGYVDPGMAMLYRLNSGMGTMGGVHPAFPGTSQQAAPATVAGGGGDALSVCQNGLKTASAFVAECHKDDDK